MTTHGTPSKIGLIISIGVFLPSYGKTHL
jgi:hypothetical protein